MASAMLYCPRLLKLDVSSCHKLSDAGVRAAATACPLLTYLDISNCSYVSDETLREISLACTHLRSLDASYCPNISLEVSPVKALLMSMSSAAFMREVPFDVHLLFIDVLTCSTVLFNSI